MSEMRMNAYYYRFTPTGVEAIDRILSAVACAGKAYHHTEQWTDKVYDLDAAGNDVPAPYQPFLRGWTVVEWIQNAANDAAAAFAAERLAALGDHLRAVPVAPFTASSTVGQAGEAGAE